MRLDGMTVAELEALEDELGMDLYRLGAFIPELTRPVRADLLAVRIELERRTRDQGPGTRDQVT